MNAVASGTQAQASQVRGAMTAPERDESKEVVEQRTRFDAWLHQEASDSTNGCANGPQLPVHGNALNTMDESMTVFEWAALAQYSLSQVTRQAAIPTMPNGGAWPSPSTAKAVGQVTGMIAPTSPVSSPTTDTLATAGAWRTFATPMSMFVKFEPGLVHINVHLASLGVPLPWCLPLPPHRRSIVSGSDQAIAWWWIRDYFASDKELQQLVRQLTQTSEGPISIIVNGRPTYSNLTTNTSGESAWQWMRSARS